MPILPDQLHEQYPDRVGAFTGWYEVNVVYCDNPEEDANPSQRRTKSSSFNRAGTIKAIETWAAQKVQDHLEYHLKMGTTPCRPIIGSTSAVYRSPYHKEDDVLVPLDLLEGALAST